MMLYLLLWLLLYWLLVSRRLLVLSMNIGVDEAPIKVRRCLCLLLSWKGTAHSAMMMHWRSWLCNALSG